MEWWYLGGGVVGGLLLGVLISKWVPSAQRRELQQTREELEVYRSKVTRHFARTAELVEVLAANSREIYQHLAKGSQELCAADAVRLNNDALLKPPTADYPPAVAAAMVAERGGMGAALEPAPVLKPREVEIEPAEAPNIARSTAAQEWTEILPEGAYQATARLN